MTVIDDYLTTVEPSKRKELERIRALAKQTVPGAEEAIVYGMPTLKDQLHDYSFSKGAIRVPLDHPISEEMLKHIIHLRLKEITPS